MKKTVTLFNDYDHAHKAAQILLNHQIADYTLTELSADYEQQIRQEIFLSRRESVITIIGSITGAILLGFLFYWLVQNHSYGYLYARFLAGTIRAATFTGVGIGFALGWLLSGIYALSMPLHHNHTGKWLMVLYTDGLEQFARARNIVKDEDATFL